jgi:hypothetical protein
MSPYRLLAVFAVVAMLVFPAVAVAEDSGDIELTRDLHGLNVEIKARRGTLSVVMLTNRSRETVRCSVGFSLNGRAPVVRQVSLHKDRKVSLTHPARGDAGKLKVSVTCSKAARATAEPEAGPGPA